MVLQQKSLLAEESPTELDTGRSPSNSWKNKGDMKTYKPIFFPRIVCWFSRERKVVNISPAQIPPCRQGDDEEEEEEGKRGEEKVRPNSEQNCNHQTWLSSAPVQDVKTAVPKESDVDVIA